MNIIEQIKFHTGLQILGIELNETEIINDILLSMEENKKWNIWKQQLEEWKERFKVQFGLTKKDYEQLKKDTEKMIAHFKEQYRKMEDREYSEYLMDKYIEKKKKIMTYISKPKDSDTIDKIKAKEYPIENLLTFKRGFTKCLWHEEKTSSLHWNKNNNTAHCFGACGSNYDSIDVAMKIYNLTFVDAVKKLCN